MFYFLDTLTDIGIFRLFLILKIALNIIFIVVPLMLIILVIKDLVEIVLKPDNNKTNLKRIATRTISALTIFLLPTIISYAFTLIEDFDSSKISYYYNNASTEKIGALNVLYNEEQKASLIQNRIEGQELLLKKQIKEQQERDFYKNNQISEPSTGMGPSSTTGGGTPSGGTSTGESSGGGNSSGGSSNTTPGINSTGNFSNISSGNGTVDASCGKRAQTQTLTYNGQELGQDASITIKKGETARIQVKVTDRCGENQLLTRTTADGQSGWRNYLSASSYPFVNRHDSSTFIDSDTYEWVITGNKTTKDEVILSQTSFQKTSNFDEIKSMVRLHVNVVE